jgi:hypothetical protein
MTRRAKARMTNEGEGLRTTNESEGLRTTNEGEGLRMTNEGERRRTPRLIDALLTKCPDS